MIARARTWLLVVGFCAGCSSGETGGAPVPPAPPPPAPPPGAPPPVQVGPASAPSNGDESPFAALKALGAAAQQLSQGAQAPGGPVVNWRDLVAFAPAELGGFVARGEVEGSTTSVPGMGNMQVTRVGRKYEAKGERMSLEIVDTSLAPMLRAPFALVTMVQEDSSDGYKKGVTVKGQPAMAEWRKGGRSELHLLAGQRFIINVEVETQAPGVAERVGEALDLAGLLALAARTAAAAPSNPAPPVQP